MSVIHSFCLSCASVTVFEQPPCADEHGTDCPEWICKRCGAAVLIGVWPSVPTQVVVAAQRRRRAHSPQAA
ncbi:MAG: hypothetical protein AUI14_10025 [Actinobacteria bacterium 13_2_20CM_2_71_6]|nr:MAG: hypothetical protein AUI14_10025 [Actinobacteria bacterium 13_2_20CM_2_71_6]